MPSRASTSFLLAVGNKIEMQEIPECQCPLGLIPHFYHNSDGFSFGVLKCQCPHGLIPHFYLTGNDISVKQLSIVSMPSRASTSFLQRVSRVNRVTWSRCQCPHGLVPHFYKNSFRDAMLGMDMCQCPHGLVPHFYQYQRNDYRLEIFNVSMPSRASTSFLLDFPGWDNELRATRVNALSG